MPCSPKDAAVAVNTRSIMAADSSDSAAPSGQDLVDPVLHLVWRHRAQRAAQRSVRLGGIRQTAGGGQHVLEILESDIRHHDRLE